MKDLTMYGNECIENLNAIGIYPNNIEKFEVNKRARGRWGQAKKRDGKYTININVQLLADECPEKALIETLYHELLHCVDGCMNHGKEWQRLADIVNDCYNVKVKRTNTAEEKVGNEYASVIIKENKENKNLYIVRCTKCANEVRRRGYRAPKWYMHPNYYYCSKCGGALERAGALMVVRD